LSSDLLGIPDRDVWAYGQTLRSLAKKKGFDKHIKFARLNDLLHPHLVFDDSDIGEMAYVANATQFRRLLLNNFSRPDWDADKEISGNPDTHMTYKGYLRFLETDLEHVYPLGEDRSHKAYRRGVRSLARQMLWRGDVSYPPQPW